MLSSVSGKSLNRDLKHYDSDIKIQDTKFLYATDVNRLAIKSDQNGAFTLAEILIALSIIGVIAALTIPSLLVVNQKKEVSTSLKKFYTIMQQVSLQASFENNHEEVILPSNEEETKKFYNTHFAPYLQTLDVKFSGPTMNITLNDGTMFGCYRGGAYMDCQFDANGPKGPNKNSKDIQWFAIDSKLNVKPYDWDAPTTREDLLSYCGACEGVRYCAKLLQYDNWEFKDDYPCW